MDNCVKLIKIMLIIIYLFPRRVQGKRQIFLSKLLSCVWVSASPRPTWLPMVLQSTSSWLSLGLSRIRPKNLLQMELQLQLQVQHLLACSPAAFLMSTRSHNTRRVTDTTADGHCHVDLLIWAIYSIHSQKTSFFLNDEFIFKRKITVPSHKSLYKLNILYTHISTDLISS